MVQVNLEETNDATFDVGTPRGLRGVERDLANGAHGPEKQTNKWRERERGRVKSPADTVRETQGNTIIINKLAADDEGN